LQRCIDDNDHATDQFGLPAWTIAHRRLIDSGLPGAGASVLMHYTPRLPTLHRLHRPAGVVFALALTRDDPTWQAGRWWS
jgi:hypothetical protein